MAPYNSFFSSSWAKGTVRELWLEQVQVPPEKGGFAAGSPRPKVLSPPNPCPRRGRKVGGSSVIVVLITVISR